MSTPANPVQAKPDRGEERRIDKTDPPGGIECRKSIADRRHENNLQYVTFYLEDHFLGVEVEKVQEVFKTKEMTRVPLASKEIAGLINLRGHIIITVDLRTRLGFKARETGDKGMSIVVATNEGQVNLLVDRIGGVIEVRSELFEPTPSTLDDRLKNVIKGIYKLQDRLLLALTTDKVSKVDYGGY